MENKYVKYIRQYLKEKYSKVNPEWELAIDLLADNIDMYNKCKEIVDSVGIYDYEKGKKNPLLGTMKETQGVMLKQIQHLGISPYALSKIKNMAAEDDTDDFIDRLTS